MKWLSIVVSGLIVGSTLAVLGFWMYSIRMPGESYTGQAPPLDPQQAALEQRLRGHVQHLAADIGPRHMGEPQTLEQTARWITQTFEDIGYVVHREEVVAHGQSVSNVYVERAGADDARVLIVGAHYDTVPGSPGADDNASGVAVLIELARLAHERDRPGATLRFIAFVNEEAPWFGTNAMGSLAHAKRATERDEVIAGMYSLEMLGVYSRDPNSQRYPAGLNVFYPDRGNFVSFVGNVASRRFVRESIRSFRGHAAVASEAVAAPEWLRDIARSDHSSFWHIGVPALMVTDTANFRYDDYHTPRDTPEKLDYVTMARVTLGLWAMLQDEARPMPGAKPRL